MKYGNEAVAGEATLAECCFRMDRKAAGARGSGGLQMSEWPCPGVGRRALAALFVISALCVAPPALGSGEDADWPCVQRLVPEVSAGMVWGGPAPGKLPDWRSDKEISNLSDRLADRRLPAEDAEPLVSGFAETQGADKDRRLTILFASILDRLNEERSSVIDAIKRYARRQKALASRIEATLAEIDRLPEEGTEEQQLRRDELAERNRWDTRIYEERERTLTYLCETPVSLERKIFSLSRTIQNHLD